MKADNPQDMNNVLRKIHARFLSYLSCLGGFGSIRWAFIRAASWMGIARGEKSVHPNCLDHPLTVRTCASSDPAVVDQIFVKREFRFLDLLPGPIKVVLDLGSNIGCASALLLSTFPAAFVIAVEPDPANFWLCQRNLRPYGDRAEIICGAVWHSCGNLVLSRGTFGDGKEWATEVRTGMPGERTDVTAYSIPRLLDMYSIYQVDLLKIDIEGSEKALFTGDTRSWLTQTRNICVELHGPECRSALLSALQGYDYQVAECGEYTLCLNIKARSKS